MINKGILVGNLAADPKYTRGDREDQDRVEFTVMVNQDGPRDDRAEPYAFDVVKWGKQAESLSRNLARGRKVYVEGKMEPRRYKNQQDEWVRSFRINAYQIEYLDSPRDDRDDDRGSRRDDRRPPRDDRRPPRNDDRRPPRDDRDRRPARDDDPYL